jgi:hypothetical protein
VCPSQEEGCCPHGGRLSACPDDSGPADLPDAGLTERVGHLYQCSGLSTYRIAAIVGISRQRVGRVLRQTGVPVKPRGAGRRRRPGRDSAVIAVLYLRWRLTSAQISELTGIPERTVRDRLRADGVTMRSRGRYNREDRQTVPADVLADLYVRAGLSAAETGSTLGVPGHIVLRAAHDLGLPVRLGGPPPHRGPAEIRLVDALYGDPLVRRVLARYGLARVPPGGPISRRFPAALAIGPEAAAAFYVECGLSLRHIELLSGQPAETVRALLRRQGIRLRGRGGRSPFVRRWRAGGDPEGEQAGSGGTLGA